MLFELPIVPTIDREQHTHPLEHRVVEAVVDCESNLGELESEALDPIPLFLKPLANALLDLLQLLAETRYFQLHNIIGTMVCLRISPGFSTDSRYTG